MLTVLDGNMHRLVTDFLFFPKDAQEFFRIKVCPLLRYVHGNTLHASPGSKKSTFDKIHF